MPDITAIAIIYRVSTERQIGDERHGLDSQRTVVTRVRDRYGLADVEARTWTLPDVSGSDLAATPEWRNEVLPYLASPGHHLVAAHLDRIQRVKGTDFRVLADLLALPSPTWVYTDEGAFDLQDRWVQKQLIFSGLSAGDEALAFRRRSKEAQELMRQRGLCPQGDQTLPTGVGYRRGRGIEAQERWHWTEDAHRVRLAFDLVLSGETNLTEIARRCGIVSNLTVVSWIRDPVYRGVRRYDTERQGPPAKHTRRRRPAGRQPVKSMVPRAADRVIEVRLFPADAQLVSDADWRRANQILDDLQGQWVVRRQHTRARTRRVAPFSGFLLSMPPIPEGVMVFDGPDHRIYGRRSGREHRYVCECQMTRSNLQKCGMPSMLVAPINEALTRYLASLLDARWFRSALTAAGSQGSALVPALRARLLDLGAAVDSTTRRRNRLIDLHLDGAITRAEYDARAAALEKQLATAEAHMREATAELARLEQDGSDIDKVPGIIEDTLRTWQPDADPDTQVHWLTRHIAGLEVDQEGIQGVRFRITPRTWRCAEHTVSWVALLGYDPLDATARREGTTGLVPPQEVVRRLGLRTYNQLKYLLRKQIITEPAYQEKGRRYWTSEEIESARQALKDAGYQ